MRIREIYQAADKFEHQKIVSNGKNQAHFFQQLMCDNEIERQNSNLIEELKQYQQIIKSQQNPNANPYDFTFILFEICHFSIFRRLLKIYQNVQRSYRFIMMLDQIRKEMGNSELIKMKGSFIQAADRRKHSLQKQIDWNSQVSKADIFFPHENVKKKLALKNLTKYCNIFEIYVDKGIEAAQVELKKKSSKQYFQKKTLEIKKFLQTKSDQISLDKMKQEFLQKKKLQLYKCKLRKQQKKRFWKFGCVELKKGSLDYQFYIQIKDLKKKLFSIQKSLEKREVKREQTLEIKKADNIQQACFDIEKKKGIWQNNNHELIDEIKRKLSSKRKDNEQFHSQTIQQIIFKEQEMNENDSVSQSQSEQLGLERAVSQRSQQNYEREKQEVFVKIEDIKMLDEDLEISGNSFSSHAFQKDQRELISLELFTSKKPSKYSLSFVNSAEFFMKQQVLEKCILPESEEQSQMSCSKHVYEVFTSWVLNWSRIEKLLVSPAYFHLCQCRCQIIAMLIEIEMMKGRQWLIQKENSFRTFIESKRKGVQAQIQKLITENKEFCTEKRNSKILRKRFIMKQSQVLFEVYSKFHQNDDCLAALACLCRTKSNLKTSFKKLRVILPELIVRDYAKYLNEWRCETEQQLAEINLKINLDEKKQKFKVTNDQKLCQNQFENS